ncbi:MAG: hypothetical protein GX968_06615 [Tissierellia bacterium]|nr:hypothetical protein [Tissierellia bacterium]
MKTKNKIILIIILLALTSYLIKTNKPKEESVEKVEIKSEPKKVFTMKEPEFWIEKLENKDDILMNSEKIVEYNNKSFSKVDVLADLWEHNPSIEKKELTNLINSISSIPKEERFNRDGNTMDKDYYNSLLNNLNLDSLSNTNAIKYGITIERTNFRTFPTYEPSYRKQGDIEFDRFQETAVYPLEPLIIYTKSKDGEWYFARMYNYVGWIPQDKVLLGEKEEIFNFINQEKFLVVVDRQVSIEDKLFDMGIRIPLKEEREDSYIILIPESGDNKLEIVEKEILKSKGLHLGYLPYTKENIILQAFKFKNEPYGWGGLNNTRDCSAFIMDIYRCFGIKLPRNTQDQGAKSLGIGYDLKHTGTTEEKLEFLEEIPAVTVLYMPGHTMLYLGKEQGDHYIIHQFAGYYDDNNGNLEYIPMMKTALTPITIKTSSGKTYLENIYLGKEFIIE